MSDITRLQNALKSKFGGKQDKTYVTAGILGSSSGAVTDPDVPSHVYVDIGNSFISVYADSSIPRISGLPVFIGYSQNQPTLLQVVEVRMRTSESSYVAERTSNHHSQHEWPSEDSVYVGVRQLLPLRLIIVPPFGITTYPGHVWINDQLVYVDAIDTVDLIGNVPVTPDTERLVWFTINSAGTVVQIVGDEAAFDTISETSLPEFPGDTYYIIGAVRLFNGQTTIFEGNSGTDMLDLRFPMWHRHGDTLLTSDFTDIQRFGFLNQTETTISFDGTNTFTLAPVGTAWSYWRSGLKYTVTGSKTIVLAGSPVATGVYYIYIDATDGTLSSSTTSWTLLDTKVPVAVVIFNNSLTPKYHMADERHTCLIDRRMHYYEHSTNGAQLISGGGLSGYTLDSDNNASHTFGIAAAALADEDIIHNNAAISDPDGATAVYTLFYRTGANSWSWRSSDQPFPYTTTGYIEYDNAGTLTAGTGGAGANTRWINSYVIQTNLNGNAEVIIIPGQNIYTNLAAAQAENPAGFTLVGLPFSEFVITWRLTWALRGGSSKGKCELDVAPSAVNISGVTASASGSVAHNMLAGLQGGAPGEYYHLTSAQVDAIGTGGGSSGEIPGATRCRVYQGAATSITGGSWVTILFNTEEYDTENMHDTATNTDRITIPTTGMYLVGGTVTLANNVVSGLRITDGTNVLASQKQGNSGNPEHVSISAALYLTAGTYVNLQGYSGSTQNTSGNNQTVFWAVKLQDTGVNTFAGAHVHRSTDQSISDSTWTAVDLPNEQYDTADMHSEVSNTSRVVVPTTGYYSFKATIQWDVNNTGDRYIAFRVNGSLVGAAVAGYYRTSAYFISLHTIDWNLNAGDYVELYAYQNSGGSLNVKAARLSVSMISASVVDSWNSADPMTYSSADSPSFVMTCIGDKTSLYTPGMRIKLTQTTDKYFIVTKVVYTTVTEITLYGGTDYSLTSASIINPKWSSAKAPAGFPLSPNKWTQVVTDTGDHVQNNPVNGTWYNLGSISISIPIGSWRLEYYGTLYSSATSGNGSACQITLSTANNSESDALLTASSYIAAWAVGDTGEHFSTLTKSAIIDLTAKTSYYLNECVPVANQTGLRVRGNYGTTVLRATCAYL